MAQRRIVRRRWSKQVARIVKPRLELLEDRTLLSGNFSGWTTAAAPYSSYFSVSGNSQSGNYAAPVPVGVAHPTFEIARPAPHGFGQPVGDHGPLAGGGFTPAYGPSQSPAGYWPAQLRHVYGFDKLTLDGSGRTIAIVDAYDDPNIASDLATFDAQFNLPAPPSFLRVDQYGNNPSSVPPDSSGGWEVEEALDVEWAHAIAPKANIILVEAYSNSFSDLLTAVDYARHAPGVVAVSMSWGGGEDPTETSADSHFTTPAGHAGVTFVASSGDNGAPGGYPAMSPNVLAIGGTTLALGGSDNRTSEVGWNGSGGGPSFYESEPGYQRTYAQSSYVRNTLGNTVLLNSPRGNPDVSYISDPNPGVAMYDTYPNQFGIFGWAAVGGTSVAAPQWAALMALVDQGRGAAGSLDGATQTLPALYQLGASPTSYPNDFFDVTSGSNGYPARAGYDFVTGLGSPRADHLIPDLIGNQGPVSFSVTTSTGSPVAGAAFSVTVTALDASGHTFTGYRGTVHFTTSDRGTGVVLPANYTFTAGDGGVHTFSNGVILVTAGTQTVTATDTANSGLAGQAHVTVTAAAASTLAVSAPASVTQGSPFTLTVTARDRFGNRATGYRGTVHFTTSDRGAGVVLPANYTFTAGDGGAHTFTNGATLVTVGTQTVTATDTAASSISGQASVNVTPVPSGNLIVNPGFETGNFSGWSTVAAPYSSYFGVGGNPHSGNYAAYFGSYLPPDRDEIYQNVPTIPGHTYHISYWVANGGGGSTEIRSSWGGTVLEDLFPNNAFSYQQHSFDVVATSTSTEFRIGGYQVPSYWYLDDVSITDTTTPGTSRVVMGTDIANGNIVKGSNNIRAFEVHQGDSGPGLAKPFLDKPSDLDVASLLPAVSPIWASFPNSTPATALSAGKLPGREVGTVDRFFASLHQGDAAFGLSAALRRAHSEADFWAFDPFRGDELLFI
jgi:hypothetical protein